MRAGDTPIVPVLDPKKKTKKTNKREQRERSERSMAMAAAPKNPFEDEAYDLCKRLFCWVCANCTRERNPVSPPTHQMLEYSQAVLRRYVDTKKRNLALLEHKKSIEDWENSGKGVVHKPEPPQPIPMTRVPQPPSIPPLLLQSQRCQDCNLPYIAPSFSLNSESPEIDIESVMGVNMGLFVASMTCNVDFDEGIKEEGEVDEMDENQALATSISSLGTSVEKAASPPEVLATLTALNQMGVTESTVANALAGHTGSDPAVQSKKSRGLVHGTAIGALRLRPPPQLPLVVICYDRRMLLHEQFESRRAGGLGEMGRYLGSDVVLPAQPVSLHPERPDRLRAIIQHLHATGILSQCTFLPARPALRSELITVHSFEHCEYMEKTLPLLLSKAAEDAAASMGDSGQGNSLIARTGIHFDGGGDVFANEFTGEAALLAAGGVIECVNAVITGKAARGLALVRPPGHHAEHGKDKDHCTGAQGFCLYNNVAVAVGVAKQKYGSKRVLIFDWDVHHGNGTENMFYSDPTVLYISIHRYDSGSFYPGTGHATRTGRGPGLGYNVNIGWSCEGPGDAEYEFAMDSLVLPIANEFSPDLVVVSAGFDAARGDPLGGCDLTPTGYARMTHKLISLSGGRCVVALEGGYNLQSISASAEAVLRVLLGETPPPLHHALPSHLHTSPSSSALGLNLSPENAAAYDRFTSGGRSIRPHTPPWLDATPGFSGEEENPAFTLWKDTLMEEAKLDKFFGDDVRRTMLLNLAPSKAAVADIAETARELAPFWPSLGLWVDSISQKSSQGGELFVNEKEINVEEEEEEEEEGEDEEGVEGEDEEHGLLDKRHGYEGVGGSKREEKGGKEWPNKDEENNNLLDSQDDDSSSAPSAGAPVIPKGILAFLAHSKPFGEIVMDEATQVAANEEAIELIAASLSGRAGSMSPEHAEDEEDEEGDNFIAEGSEFEVGSEKNDSDGEEGDTGEGVLEEEATQVDLEGLDDEPSVKKSRTD